jgi:hypothetical protein
VVHRIYSIRLLTRRQLHSAYGVLVQGSLDLFNDRRTDDDIAASQPALPTNGTDVPILAGITTALGFMAEKQRAIDRALLEPGFEPVPVGQY